ncbi:MAG: hypothetical protein HQL47_00420 [Gammaproteobacteria bacterium]|nr:hypothetical protein [Gammaproteobacteria bacterium]
MTIPRPDLLLGLGLTLALAASPALARTFFDFQLDANYEDNVGRAEADADRLSDRSHSLGAAVKSFHLLGDHAGVTFKGSVEQVDFARLDGLDRLNLGLGANLRYKPDLAYGAPWYGLNLNLTQSNFDSSLRDGVTLDLEAMAGKRFTDRILGKLGLGYNEHFVSNDLGPKVGKSDPEVFATQNTRLFAGLDYNLSNWVVYANYTYQVGDVVSTSTPTAKAIAAADAIWKDDAIGPSYTTTAPAYPGGMVGSMQQARYAYRIDADTQIADVGFNYAITRSTALDFMLRYVDVQGEGGNDYDNYSAHLGLYYRLK